MIRLLAVDMDGTCLDSKHRFPDAVMEALRRAADAGILVVPTTGRTATCLPAALAQEKFYRYIISSNGAQVTDLADRSSLFRALIPAADSVPLLRACRKNGIGISAHIRHQFLIEGVGLNLLGRAVYRQDAKNSRYAKDIAGMLERHCAGAEELQLFCFTKKTRAALHRLVDENKKLSAAFTPYYAEVYAPEASKGNALAALAAKLSIPKEEIACVGDAENDLSMFAVSGLRFAMGNAIPELKSQADTVLPTNDEAGVAAAVRQILGENPS